MVQGKARVHSDRGLGLYTNLGRRWGYVDPTPDLWVVCAGAEDDGGVPSNLPGRNMTSTRKIGEKEAR